MARTDTYHIGRDLGFWRRTLDAVRSYTLGPLTSRSPELAKYWGLGGPTSAGVTVTERTAVTVSAVWAAVSLISDDVSSLPLMLYKRLANGGKDKFEAHPLYALLHDEPNPEMGSMVFRRTLQAHALIWGNGYAEIERDGAGRPVALWPLVPERVRIERSPTGAMQYHVSSEGSGPAVIIDPANMLHILGQSYDGTTGANLVYQARESLGLALAAERYGGAFFGNGATVGGVVSLPGPKPKDEIVDGHRAQLEQRHQGVERAHKLLLLYNGAKYERNNVEPNNAQYLETRVFQVREVARWFKVPPHKLADLADATFSNVEQMNTEYYVSAIRPWLVLWEQELGRKLIHRLERRQQFIEHTIEGFLRGDSASRAAFYTALFNVGALTINEIRGYENLDPLPGGEQSFVQVNNLMPLSKVGDYVDATIKALDPPTPAPVPPPVDPNPSPAEVNAVLAALEARTAEQVATLEAVAGAERERAASTARDLAIAALDVEVQRSFVAERDRALALAEAAAAEAVAARLDIRRRMEAGRQAQRAVILDTVQRLVQRESDRASKQLASPEKFRAWVASFYPLQVDYLRAAYRPAALALAALADTDSDDLLRTLVADHVDTSRRELLNAAETFDADELAANVSRVLRRWESERAGAVADRLLAGGANV